MRKINNPGLWVVLCALLAACEAPEQDQAAEAGITLMGFVESPELDEISGIQASLKTPGVFFVHNDEGEPLVYAIDHEGRDLGQVSLFGAKNKDWEDLATIPGPSGPVLVAGDIGDNSAKRKKIRLYLVDEPTPGADGSFSGQSALLKEIELRYPDGKRDLESMAYDPLGKRLLFLTKRDKPPRLYALSLDTIWSQNEAELEFLTTVETLRVPSISDRAIMGGQANYASQPVGMDISPDGQQAVVLTYRSVYLYELGDHSDWADAFTSSPTEFIGPPSAQEEAITFTPDGTTIYISAEALPAPVFRFRLLDVQPSESAQMETVTPKE